MLRKFTLLCFCLFSVSIAYAHPPQEIRLNYDPKTKILKAEIVHIVSNPASHYISKVDVALNGKEIIEHKISRQDNNNLQSVIYLIPDVQNNDIISIEAYCSISGKLTKKIKVGD